MKRPECREQPETTVPSAPRGEPSSCGFSCGTAWHVECDAVNAEVALVKQWPVLFIGLLIPACAHEGYPPAGDASAWRASTKEHDDDHDDDAVPNDPATVARARSISVVPQNDAGCESEVLGLVDVHEGAKTQDQALDILR